MSLHAIFVWLMALVWLPAAQTDGLSLSAQAGFDGLYRESAATPVVVSVRNDGPPIEGVLQVAVGNDFAGEPLLYRTPISLPTQSDKRVTLYVHLPPFAGDLTVQLVADDAVLAETNTNRLDAAPADDLLYAVVSPDPGGLAFLETIPGRRTAADVAFVELAGLPDLSVAWNALDVLVLDDTDTSRLTAGQSAALRMWVENGGQLVITGGPGGPKTAAGVAGMLPVTVGGVATLAELPALGEFAGSAPPAGPIVVTESTLREGELLIHQDGLPILSQRDAGLGGVSFLALDPKLAPLAGWEGQRAVWESIASRAPARAPWGQSVRDGYAAAQAVSVFPGLALPSVGQLVLFLFLYTLIIGPVNYVVLRRLNRRELAWVTIPALVLLFSAVTYFTGFRARGEGIMLNEMTVAFGSIEAEQVRAQTVIGLYSPRRGRHDLTLPYDTAAFPFDGQGFGVVTGVNNLEAIVRAGDLTLSGIRTDTSEVATFLAEAHRPRPALSGAARAIEGGAMLEVTVRNDGATTLEDAVIVYAERLVSLGDLAAGEERVTTLPAPAAASGTAIPTPDPLFPSGAVVLPPLINDPSPILGTTDYFNDARAFPRWQLIQSLYYFTDTMAPLTTEAIVLGGWLPGEGQAVAGGDEAMTRTALTLVLLEISVR